MRIKCPACQTLLQVPDSAAGKVVKCTCGNQLRLPAATAPSAATAPNSATAPSAATRMTGGPVAAPRSTPADTTGFDDLTANDLQPMRAGNAAPSASRSAAQPAAAGSTSQPKRTGAIVSFVFAGLLFCSGAGAIFTKLKPDPTSGRAPDTALMAGYAVGSMLPSVLLLALGVHLWKRGTRRASAR